MMPSLPELQIPYSNARNVGTHDDSVPNSNDPLRLFVCHRVHLSESAGGANSNPCSDASNCTLRSDPNSFVL
jgi:hypothetical protein